MEKKHIEKMYVDAKQIAEEWDVSKGYAYDVIKKMNSEIKAEYPNAIILPGKVNKIWYDNACLHVSSYKSPKEPDTTDKDTPMESSLITDKSETTTKTVSKKGTLSIRITEQTRAKLKIYAAKHNTTISDLIEDFVNGLEVNS